MATTVTRWATLIGYFGLLGTLSVWHGWISPAERVPTALVLIVLLTPLLFPLRGLLQGKPYTHAWTSFVALFYFTLGVSHAAVEEERFYGILQILTSLLLFFGCILYARFRSRQLRADVGKRGSR
jgi:uncharacterized membrane protein